MGGPVKSVCERKASSSEGVDHVFAAMIGIADQPLADRIDDEIEPF
jgi:hypothetical protein